MITNHDSRLAARRELANHGYTVGFSPPDAPEIWIRLNNTRDRKAIARVVVGCDETWRIMAYPDTWSGEVMRAGKLLNTAETADVSWLD